MTKRKVGDQSLSIDLPYAGGISRNTVVRVVGVRKTNEGMEYMFTGLDVDLDYSGILLNDDGTGCISGDQRVKWL